MAGTKEGGKLAATLNKQRHGEDFYQRIGRRGGQRSDTGGFASPLVGADGLTGRERAKQQGKIGGRIGKRGKARKDVVK